MNEKESVSFRWRSAWRVSLMDILRRVDSEAEFKKGRSGTTNKQTLL